MALNYILMSGAEYRYNPKLANPAINTAFVFYEDNHTTRPNAQLLMLFSLVILNANSYVRLEGKGSLKSLWIKQNISFSTSMILYTVLICNGWMSTCTVLQDRKSGI